MTSRGSSSAVAITGLGVVTSVATSVEEFHDALMAGAGNFTQLRRPGRESDPPFLGAEIDDAALPSLGIPHADRLMMRATLEGRVALHAVAQAWSDAELHSGKYRPTRIGLVVGGTSSEFREHSALRERYRSRMHYLTPTYAASCWTTYLVGLISDAFGICGEGLSVGGASAAGTVAVIQAARQIQCGLADAIIVVAPMADLSRFELQGFRSAGALGGERFLEQPDLACRPFDSQSDGFVFGEGCGAVVLEAAEHWRDRPPRAWLAGSAIQLQGSHSMSPDTTVQQRTIYTALEHATMHARHIDYVNTHGTGTPLGDQTELETLRACGLVHAALNSTKSITGHCLTGSGALEIIATVLQMQSSRIHPTRNLTRPIDKDYSWVVNTPLEQPIHVALSTSFAFGGLNTSVIMTKEHPSVLHD